MPGYALIDYRPVNAYGLSMTMSRAWLTLTVLEVMMVSVVAEKLDHQKRVVLDTFNGYKTNLRPVNHTSDILDVSIGFVLQNLVELHSAHQILSIRGIFVITWKDASLVWSPEDYGGVRNITVRQKNIWIPDIVLEDSMMPSNALGQPDLMLTVDHTGTVVWRPSDIYHLACSIDITYFPYDTQRCPMVLITWVSNIYEVSLSYDQRTTVFDPLHPNGLWDLMGYEVSKVRSKSNNPVMTFTLGIKRKPAYYIVNIFLPVFLLSAVNLLVFLLPEACGEKIGLNITVLLAFVVFLSLLGSNLPVTSRQTSHMTIYVTLLLTVSCLSLVSTSLVLALHDFSKDTQIPKAIMAVVGALTCRRKPRACRISATKMALQGTSANTMDTMDFRDDGDGHKEQIELPPKDITVSWRDVAKCMDRIFFVVFSLINVLAAAVILVMFNSR